MFNLAISCLTTSNLPWFMDLTFQVPIQYCSLLHQTLLSTPNTLTAECHFHFGPATSLFLKLLVIALHSSPVAYCTPSDLGGGGEGSSSSVIFFAFSYCPWSSPGKNIGVGCHFLLQWTTFYQSSSPWPIHLRWHCTTWFKVSLSYSSPFATTKLWAMNGKIIYTLTLLLFSKLSDKKHSCHFNFLNKYLLLSWLFTIRNVVSLIS